MDMATPMQPKPLVNATCKLGEKGCFKDGRCHALGVCENKIVTNADRIRAMTDDELAVFICDRVDTCSEKRCPGAALCKGADGKANGLKKWLQWPAEEDDG